ncbi:hypothetical protein N7447_010458 [Penicillium robsamsonii]|uniref:uncharacterized protein n=1 Tax=Penicillium robsamsonii TaxID=1792511 RepID=UPI00254875FC|nr:uncharacterized protein N7447_010458 [Penicillium robsamsonii]KAJ5810942.1 hypothetical protein N7447_010458 [Penicillium robsamsonii]
MDKLCQPHPMFQPTRKSHQAQTPSQRFAPRNAKRPKRIKTLSAHIVQRTSKGSIISSLTF